MYIQIENVIQHKEYDMLISFRLANWMSFREEVNFSMVATKERQHGERIPAIKKYQTRILPIAAIYGGNASGKTNFFKALNFVKQLVVRGTQPESIIPLETFKLDSKAYDQPAFFSFELLINKLIYDFSFSVTKKAIIEEKLIEITSSSERILYHRKNGIIDFDSSLKKEKEFLDFVFKGTRNNQLFLTNSVSQKIEDFRPVYDWFRNNLVLIAPDSRFGTIEHFLDVGNPLYSAMNESLPLLDTGITRFGGEEMSLDNTSLPEFMKKRLQEEIKEDMTVRLFEESTKECLIISRKKGELKIKKLVTYHSNTEGTETKFDISWESDGSQRVINLLPAFLTISEPSSNKIYVIDELDRSLHTLLTRQLLELYLSNCSLNTRSQMLFTTHDVQLMDQELFRRDEMWVAERNAFGNSTLIPFSNYKDVRYDKDIRKSYLQGRMGGIPRIITKSLLINSQLNKN